MFETRKRCARRSIWFVLSARELGLIVTIALCSLDAGCAASWDGRVQHWGELRQVMREGQTEARVALLDVLATPHCYAIGALEHLGGEVTIIDGAAWISRVAAKGGAVTTPSSEPQEQATILIAAWVPRWRASQINRDVSSEEFDQFVHDQAPASVMSALHTLPFVIAGEFDALKVHVVNGRCLMGTTPDPDDGSYRREFPHSRGTLLGFYTEQPPGIMTHHGTRTHVHVLLDGEEPLMAHVESVAVRRGAEIRFPYSTNQPEQ